MSPIGSALAVFAAAVIIASAESRLLLDTRRAAQETHLVCDSRTLAEILGTNVSEPHLTDLLRPDPYHLKQSDCRLGEAPWVHEIAGNECRMYTHGGALFDEFKSHSSSDGRLAQDAENAASVVIPISTPPSFQSPDHASTQRRAQHFRQPTVQIPLRAPSARIFVAHATRATCWVCDL